MDRGCPPGKRKPCSINSRAVNASRRRRASVSVLLSAARSSKRTRATLRRLRAAAGAPFLLLPCRWAARRWWIMADPAPVAILIEDEKQIRRFVRTALEAGGWSVHETDTG